jgi:hypothetical protein
MRVFFRFIPFSLRIPALYVGRTASEVTLPAATECRCCAHVQVVKYVTQK